MKYKILFILIRDSETPAVSQTQGSSDTWMGYLGNVVSSVPNYLPALYCTPQTIRKEKYMCLGQDQENAEIIASFRGRIFVCV